LLGMLNDFPLSILFIRLPSDEILDASSLE
jgi:hypothetical protein